MQYNEEITNELKELAKIVAPCFQCSVCASSCPVFQSDPNKNPRRIIYRLCMGEIQGILDNEDFWWCGGCYSCESHCPQKVPLTRVFYRLKNLAFRSGKPVPKKILKTGEVLQNGLLFPVTEDIKKKRQKLGLPELLKPNVEEIRNILEAAGFVHIFKKSGES